VLVFGCETGESHCSANSTLEGPIPLALCAARASCVLWAPAGSTFWELENVKTCPGCKKRIWRDGGCNHMTCLKGSGGCGAWLAPAWEHAHWLHRPALCFAALCGVGLRGAKLCHGDSAANVCFTKPLCFPLFLGLCLQARSSAGCTAQLYLAVHTLCALWFPCLYPAPDARRREA
jgi:hypothetical protein